MSLSPARRTAVFGALHAHARDILHLHTILSSLPEDRIGVYHWWLGAPNPNHFQTYTEYWDAYETWLTQTSQDLPHI